MLSNLPAKTVIGGRWEVVSVVGEGACAQVYKVKPTLGPVGYDVVAKVVPIATGKGKADKQQQRICDTLNYEYVMYNGLMCEFPHRPRTPDKFYGDDKQQNVRYLVMEQMDRDLMGFVSGGSTPSPSTIAGIGLQILRGLQWIHQKNFLFIDVKPDNFMLKGEQLYFVDFGLVERLQVIQQGQTPPKRQFAGTPTFCSAAVHAGAQPSAHDDLEAMGLVLLSLTSGGRLPWSTAKSDADCLQMKQSCDIRKLCTEQGVPEVADLILQCRNAARHVRPDYAALEHHLTKLQTRKAVAGKKAGVVAPAGKGKGVASIPAASTKADPAVKASSSSTTKRAGKKGVVVAQEEPVKEEEEPVPAPTARDAARSPAPKKARTATSTKDTAGAAAPAPVPVPVSAPAVKQSAIPAAKGARAAQASPARGRKGPFSAPAVGDPAPSPPPSARSRSSRLSAGSAAGSVGVSGGPFSASYVSSSSAPGTAQSAPTTTYTLRVTKGPCKGAHFTLSAPATGSAGKRSRKGVTAEVSHSVGHEEDCDWCLSDDAYLSGRHFTVTVSGAGVRVVDCGSTNGTTVNGTKLEPNREVQLKVGDKIKAGKTEVVVQE